MKRKGFTLVELLVALAITSLLLAVAVPVFSRVGSHTDLRRAGEVVAAGVSEAHTLAMARARRSALVMQTGVGDDDRQWRRFAVFVEELEEDGSRHWVAEGNWRTLPRGSVFASESNALAPGPCLVDEVDRIEVTTDRGQTAPLPALVFGPRGSVELSGALDGLDAVARKHALTIWVSAGRVIDGRIRQRDERRRLHGVRVHELTGATREFPAGEAP